MPMHDINKISDFISFLNYCFLENDSFAIHTDWVHSTNFDFLKEMNDEFPGEITPCEPDGCGFYLIFKNLTNDI